MIAMALRRIWVLECEEGRVFWPGDFVDRNAFGNLLSSAGEEVEEEGVEGACWWAVFR